MASYFQDYPNELRLLQVEAITRRTDAELLRFRQNNPLLRPERDAPHEVVIISPPIPMPAKTATK